MHYSDNKPDFSHEKYKDSSVLEITLNDTSQNTYCADSYHIDPIMLDVALVMKKESSFK